MLDLHDLPPSNILLCLLTGVCRLINATTSHTVLFISFAILYRIGCVTTWLNGAAATSTPIRWSSANTDYLRKTIAVDTFSVSVIWDVWHGIISWPVCCPLLAELRASGLAAGP